MRTVSKLLVPGRVFGPVALVAAAALTLAGAPAMAKTAKAPADVTYKAPKEKKAKPAHKANHKANHRAATKADTQKG